MSDITDTNALLLPPVYRWLYIDFNSYFASVEQQLHPHLRGKPIAVVPVETDATCAIAASYEAKAFGIKTGTPIYEAKRMCPGLICVKGDHENYVAFHHKILDEVNNHIPWSDVRSIDEVACRLMDNEQSETRVREIAASIKRGLAANIGAYVKCSIGVAPNMYLAKVATDMQKPDGLTLMCGERIMEALATLKLRDLPGIGHNMEKRLWMAGIYDMQTLLALPKDRMRKVWGGIWGERMWYYLRGVELPEEETTRSSLGHSHVLAPELRDPAKARFVARRLTLKCASRLRRMGYYASRFSISVRIENGPRLECAMACYRAQDSLTFLHMLDESWERLRKEARGARFKKVSVTLHHLVEEGELQPELFSQLPDVDLKARQKAENMSKALDTLNHKFGRDSVTLGMLPEQGRSFSGTKIAFTRIPDVEEFSE